MKVDNLSMMLIALICVLLGIYIYKSMNNIEGIVAKNSELSPLNINSECYPDPKWRAYRPRPFSKGKRIIMKKKGCRWVAKKPMTRCGFVGNTKERGDVRAEIACPNVCSESCTNQDNQDNQDNQYNQDNQNNQDNQDNITFSSNNNCTDNDNWRIYNKNRKTLTENGCDFVGKSKGETLKKRCKLIGQDTESNDLSYISASEACPEKCNISCLMPQLIQMKPINV